MSTTDYLEKLDLDQLRFARDKAQSMIDAIENEAKVKLWVVAGPNVNEACFKEADFDNAKKKLCELIMRDTFKPRDVAVDHPKINRVIVSESEVAEWMSLNSQ